MNESPLLENQKVFFNFMPPMSSHHSKELTNRPSLESMTHVEKEFKVPQEAIEVMKKTNDQQKKTGQFFNFTFNQEMNPKDKQPQTQATKKAENPVLKQQKVISVFAQLPK